jgi:SAM-dependent methyltransferase
MSLPMPSNDLPMPPVPLRRSVGVEDEAFVENPHGLPVFGDDLRPSDYESVLDFGCGCGRIARQLLLQHAHRPQRYLGVDLFRPSIEWCQQNLTPHAPHFEFRHLNAYNPGLNPEGVAQASIQSAEQFSLVNAHSVFTHILEPHISFYFEQAVSRLGAGGVLRATWFLFDKQLFPMLQTFQNCLYINPDDLTNATIYDLEFVKALYARYGLRMYQIHRPYLRGHQWLIYARRDAGPDVPFPADDGPIGLARPPVRMVDD